MRFATLLAMGLPRNATAMQAIGYKEFLGVLDGVLTEPEAIELVKLRSRQYAKRQLTWLRRNPGYPLDLLGKRPGFCPRLTDFDGNSLRFWLRISAGADDRSINKEGADTYAEKNKSTGSLPPASPAGSRFPSPCF